MISHRRQEVCPGGQDASEIHFLTLPPDSINIHFSLNRSFPPVRQRGGAARGEGSEGKCNRGGQVTSCCGQKSVQSPVMLEGIGWEHSIVTSSSFLPRILFPPLSSPHRSESLHLKNLHFLHKSPRADRTVDVSSHLPYAFLPLVGGYSLKPHTQTQETTGAHTNTVTSHAPR